MSVYPFIEAEKVAERNVASACALMEVSRSAFYGWHHHQPGPRALEDARLEAKIVEIHAKSRATYGAPRITAALAREGDATKFGTNQARQWTPPDLRPTLQSPDRISIDGIRQVTTARSSVTEQISGGPWEPTPAGAESASRGVLNQLGGPSGVMQKLLNFFSLFRPGD
jgi:HTH-like domain